MLTRVFIVTVLAGAFIYGIVHLFFLRFESGDVYPEYSSLRADPLGAKGLYDALREFPGLEVRRNFRPIARLRGNEPVTLIYTGVSEHAFFEGDELRRLEELLESGARIVITFFPVPKGPGKRDLEREDEREKELKKERLRKEGRKRSDKKGEKTSEAEPLAFKTVAAGWGLSFQYLQDEATRYREAVLAEPEVHVEPKISWHTALCFRDEADEWTTIYDCEEQAAIVERSYGGGSLVFCADSYFLSNEAMRKERLPQLLAWLIGSSRVIIFDEESHGVREDPGVASLVRKYHLEGAVAGLLLLAILFVWKNAMPLVPAFDDIETNGAFVTGKDASTGFVNLIRRSIGRRDIVAVCADEWKKSFNHDGRNVRAARIERLVESEEARRNPVAAYRAINRELARK